MSSKLSTLLNTNPITGAQLAVLDGFYLFRNSGSGALKSAGIRLGEFLNALVGYQTSENSSGDTLVSPGPACLRHTEVTSVTGAGSTTRVMILGVDNPPRAGATIVHRVRLPATANITLQWRHGTAGGTELTSLLTDGSGDDAAAEFVFNGAEWEFVRFTNPANA